MLKEIKNNINLLEADFSSIKRQDNEIFSLSSVVAVSKKKLYEHIKKAYENKIKNFGENYAQELDEKNRLSTNDGLDIIWHFIGPIQSNKIRIIARSADWVHSLSRTKEADILNNECSSLGKVMNVLIQVNISEEVTKSGIKKEELYSFAQYISEKKHLSLKGIMVMPRISRDTNEIISSMKESKKLHASLLEIYPEASSLSMGTTSDYKIAIACGSTMIRIGELIFGKRK